MINNTNSSDIKDSTGDTKRTLCRMSLNDLIYFCISFISLVMVPFAGLGVGQNYWELQLNKQPLVEIVYGHTGLNCSDIAHAQSDNSSNAILEDICTGTIDFEFTLFWEQDDFFFFKGSTRNNLCSSNPIPTNVGSLSGFSFENTTGLPTVLPTDVQKLFEGDLGYCSDTTLKVTEVFAFITLLFAIFMALWLTVISGHYNNTIEVHLSLAIVTMISSLTTIGVFAGAINPSRSSVESTFCESQSLFEDCNESIGAGFYCQIAVAALSFVTILICTLDLISNKSRSNLFCVGKDDDNDDVDDLCVYSISDDLRLEPSSSSSSTSDDDLNVAEDEEDLEVNSCEILQTGKHPVVLHKNIHLWIKLGRFSEFFLAILAFGLYFSSLELSVSFGNIQNLKIEIDTHMWDYKHGYCNGFSYLMGMIYLGEQAFLGKSTQSIAGVETYGDCELKDLSEVYLGFLKVIIFGGLALFLKRNAQKNPLLYLGGIMSDLFTTIFVAIAIKTFYMKIYPGRSDIDPSFCDQFDDTMKYLNERSGTSYDDPNDCNISLGPGFWVLCGVFVLTVVNFVVEFVAYEVGQEYGAFNAFQTVSKRVREGRIKDAILKPATMPSQALNVTM